MDNNKIIYSGKIRDGRFGTLTSDSYQVIYNEEKKFGYLDPFPDINYNNVSYRDLVNESHAIEDYFKLHDSEQINYNKYISPYIKRGNIVADCGCGGGSQLDLLKGLATETIAIEPFDGYHASLTQRGHQVFGSIENAINSGINSYLDIALSIHVIEHTTDPEKYLTDIFTMLKPDCKLILFTPNLDDILLKVCPDVYQPFFFRKAHNFYFTGESLKSMGAKAGFSKIEVFYYNEFGISNIFNWLKEGFGKGSINLGADAVRLDNEWNFFLENTGQSYNVGAVFTK